MPQPLTNAETISRFNSTTIVCKYCGVTIPLAGNNNHVSFYNSRKGTFDNSIELSLGLNTKTFPYLEVHFVECATCFETTIFVYLVTEKEGQNVKFNIKPVSNASIVPGFVPQEPAQDYYEAVLIAEASPRASLTLSRRALQGFIQDKFPNIQKGNLYNEINLLDNEVASPVKKALHALRDLGNIGAHPKEIAENVTQDEALHATKIIEFIIKKWYIEVHEDEEALAQIVSDSQRINPSSNLGE